MADIYLCPRKTHHESHYWAEIDPDGVYFTSYCFGMTKEQEEVINRMEKLMKKNDPTRHDVLDQLYKHNISVEQARILLGYDSSVETSVVQKEAHVTIIINDGETSTTYIIPRMEDVEFEVEMDDPIFTNYPFSVREIAPKQAVRRIAFEGKPQVAKDGSYWTQITRKK